MSRLVEEIVASLVYLHVGIVWVILCSLRLHERNFNLICDYAATLLLTVEPLLAAMGVSCAHSLRETEVLCCR